MRRSAKNNDLAFSLVELMVAVLAFAVLMTALVFALFSSRPAYQLESLKTKLIESQRLIQETIKRDLDAAIRNDGFTRSTYPGINRFPNSPRVNPDDNDALDMIVERFGQYSTNVISVSQVVTPPNPGNFVTVYVPSTAESADVHNFFTNVLQNKGLLFLTSLESTAMIRQVQPATIAGTEATIKFEATPDFNPNAYTGQTVTLRAAERVRYSLNGSNQLIREVINDLTGASQSQIVAENVTRFQIDYGFDNRRRGAVNLVLPPKTQRLSHPNDPSYYLCTPGPDRVCCTTPNQCVTAMDISDVRVILQLSAPIGDRVQTLLGSADSRFTSASGQLLFSMEDYVYPRRFSVRTELAGQLGFNPACQTNDISSRCKAECLSNNPGSPFMNPNAQGGNYPADWAGYGDPSSDYCQCGGCRFVSGSWDCSNFHNPEQAWSNPAFIPNFKYTGSANWWADPENSQINACIRHFNGCVATGGETGWQAKHPAAYLACQCVQPYDPMGWSVPQTPFNQWNEHSVSGASGVTYQYKEWTKNALTLSNIQNPIGMTWNGIPVSNPIMCYQWTQCDAYGTWLLQGDLNQTTAYPGTAPSNPLTLWDQECGCRTFSRNFDGTEGGGGVHRMTVYWDRLCNLEHRQHGGAVRCANTWDNTTNSMKVMGCSSGGSCTSYQNALTPEDAALCECLAQTPNTGSGVYDQSNVADTWNFDFRSGSVLNDAMLGGSVGSPTVPPLSTSGNVYPPSGYPNYVFGGNQSTNVSFNAIAADGPITINRVCNATYCPLRHSWGLALGCCTSPLHDSDGDGIEDWIPTSVRSLVNGTQGNFLSYINYCSPHCLGGRNVDSKLQSGANRTVNEIQRVREIITGTGPNAVNAVVAPVPTVCGDPWASSGGGL